MKASILLYFLFAGLAHAEPITIDRIFSSPELDGPVPAKLHFSPNGNRLSFLKGKTDNYEVQDLWEYDLKTGEPRLIVDSDSLKFGESSEAEKARRERMRISKKGIVEYFWSNDGQKIVFPAGGDLYLYSFGAGLKQITKKHAGELDVQFSPNDRYISFIRNQNLYFIDAKTGKEFQATTDGKGTISNGIAEFIAQEELDRFTGYWWSKDEKYLAAARINEKDVKLVDRYDISADKVTVRHERYPEAGTKNAVVQLGILTIEDVKKGVRKPVWVPLADTPDIYLADAKWTPDGKLAYQVLSRDQKRLDVYVFDPKTKKRREFLIETDAHWVNIDHDWRWLEKSPRMIWVSERSGFRHLYLYDRDGRLIHPLTQGNWQVDALTGVDEAGGWAYFTGWINSPIEKHLYRVSLDKPGMPERLSLQPGWNETEMSKDGKFYVLAHSAPLVPKQVGLFQAGGDRIAALSPNEVKAGHPLYPFRDTMVEPEFGTFKGPSGDDIFYKLYKPKDFKKRKKYPLIVLGYGGPNAQEVARAWGGKWEMFTEYLINRGFLVASFDNRGSARRGKAFEAALDHAFGTVEVEDQTAGVKHLIEAGYIDKDRVGFFGWSYGGFLSTMLAFKAPDVFKANVAVAPVTDFSLYDTCYTERYLGKPGNENAAYKQANAMEFAGQLKGHLLVIHGMADDNVLFTNSTMLFKKLQAAGKLYESVTYPGAKHGISGSENQKHVFKTIADFFERRL